MSAARLYVALALALCLAAAGYLATRLMPDADSSRRAASEPVPEASAARAATSTQPVAAPAQPASVAVLVPQQQGAAPAFQPDFELRSLEPDDVAAYMRPGDPEPTAAELIDGLNQAGIYSGLGAFTPPGTSPPLQGLAVPEDFPLPEGYVRHHQVTDEGEPLEPILMFSPDYDLLNSAGESVALPEDRVVPPEFAPPGLPIRPIEIPTGDG